VNIRVLLLLSLPVLGQSSWIATVGNYSPQAAPRWTGQAIYATKLGSEVWSYTAWSVYSQHAQLVSVTSTGLCTPFKKIRNLLVLACATAGAASSQAGLTGAFAGGGAAVLRLPKALCSGVCSIVGTMQYVSAGAVKQPVYGVGVGYAW